MDHRPAHPWVPWVGAAAGAVLALKAVLVIVSDDGAPGAMAALYLVGLLLGVVAAVGAGLRQTGLLRRLGVAVGGTALLVVWIMGLGDVLKPLVDLVADGEHARNEVPILLAGLTLLGLSWWARARDLDEAVIAETATL